MHQTVSIWALRLTFSGASLVWMAVIFLASSSSPQEVNQALEFVAWLGPLRNIIGHFVMYAVLATLVGISIWAWRRSTDQVVKWALTAAAIAIVYGITDEYHQSMVPGRAATILDVLVDSAGALSAAVGLAWLINFVRNRGQNPGRPD